MSRPADFERAKKRKIRQKALGKFLITVFSVAVLFFLYTFRYEISSQGFGVLVSDGIALLTKQSRYPVALIDEPVQLLSVGQRIAVVTNSSVNVYDPVGEEHIDDRVTGASTLADSAGNYLISYSRGGNTLRVKSGKTELFSLRTDDVILAASVSKNGSIAVATAEGSSSKVTVYDKSYREALNWTTDSTVVTALSLDDRGQSLAVGGVFSDGGMICSNLRTLSVISGKDIFGQQTFEDEMALDLCWQKNGSLTAVTDRAAYTLSSEGVKRASFDGNLAAFTVTKDGSVAAATGEYITGHEVRLTVYAPDMTQTAEVTLSEDIKRLSDSSQGLLAFTGEKVIRFDKELSRAAVMETPGALQFSAVGAKLYYTTVDRLYRINLR